MCCVPNAGRILPTYVKSMWLRSAEGLVAALYGACDLRTQVDGVDVHIAQVTEYPFDLGVTFRLTTAKPVAFTLSLRRPAWARGLAPAGADNALVTLSLRVPHPATAGWGTRNDVVNPF